MVRTKYHLCGVAGIQQRGPEFSFLRLYAGKGGLGFPRYYKNQGPRVAPSSSSPTSAYWFVP